MSTTTRVAAWQCLSGPLDVSGNLRRLDAACASAAARQVEVLVTPEMFTSGYAITLGEVLRFAEDPGGPTEAAVAEIARRHGLAIVYGHPERAAGGGAYNAATMIGPDGVVRGRHRKVHLYGDVDRGQFVANPARPAAFGFRDSRVGMLICYDVEFPESVRSLTVDGARIVFVPTANMVGCEEVQEILVRARACENNCGVVYANYCGSDDVFEYNGLSMICGPRGEVLAQAKAQGEELVIADVPGESPGTYLADRRADLYRWRELPADAALAAELGGDHDLQGARAHARRESGQVRPGRLSRRASRPRRRGLGRRTNRVIHRRDLHH